MMTETTFGEQTSLGLFAAPSGGKSVKKTHLPPYPETNNPIEYLEMLCSEKEPLIFLWGKNPNLCCVRSHSSRETLTNMWVNRRDGRAVLKWAGYHLRGRHFMGDEKADVYRR